MEKSARRGSLRRKGSWVSELNQEQIEEFRDAFSLFVKDADGTITTTELGTVVKQLGERISRRELEEMIKEVDEGGNGEIDFQEFCEFMRIKMVADGEAELLDAFRAWDTAGSGVLKADVLGAMLSNISAKLSPMEIQRMIASADKKKNGTVVFEDFVKMLLK